MVVGEFALLFPVGDEPLVPLPLVDLHQPRRVGIENPVWLLIAGNRLGQARQKCKARHAQLRGQRARVAKLLSVGVGDRGVGVQGFAMNGKGADL